MAEPLSKLAEKCKSCPKSEKCDHKRMELCALADLPPQNLASTTQSILIDNMSPVLREVEVLFLWLVRALFLQSMDMKIT